MLKKRGRAIIIILIVLILILIFIGILLFYLYGGEEQKTSVRVLEVGPNIREAFVINNSKGKVYLSEDVKINYLEKLELIFIGEEQYVLGVDNFFYIYEIESSQLGLSDFKGINKVEARISYKSFLNISPETGGGQISVQLGGGGSSGGSKTTPTPTTTPCVSKTCSDFSGQCGVFDDGCGGNLICGCDDGFYCDGGVCKVLPLCSVDENCSELSGVCGTGLCNLSSGNCYVNYSVGEICGATAGECDAEEICVLGNVDCPTDVFSSSSTVCRASAGECDAEEKCTGSSIYCPNDANKSDGTTCTGGTCIIGKCTSASGTTNKITQYNITWTFDKYYQYGQFVNGDYWVVGPVNLIRIDPEFDNITKIGRSCSLGKREYDSSCWSNVCKYTRVYSDSFYPPNSLSTYPAEYINYGQSCTTGDTSNCSDDLRFYNNIGCSGGNWVFNRQRNGNMVNPRFRWGQGYDSRAPGYIEDINKLFPAILNNGDSLISTISLDIRNKKTFLKTASVLTIVDAPQPPDKFRPPYTRPTRISVSSEDNLIFSANQINWSLLSKLDLAEGAPSIAQTTRSFERVWIDHFDGWQGSDIMPRDNMPDYGRERSILVGEAALQLLGNYPDKNKKTLLYGLVQQGIDLYGNYLDGGRWKADGGIFCGRKFPIIFAGIMLNNEIKNTQLLEFHEDQQTFYVSQWDIDATNDWDSSIWWKHPDKRDSYWIPYSSSDLGLPEWGITRARNPYTSNKWWPTLYRQCCNAIGWAGFVLAAHIMEEKTGMRTLWNHPALFDYMDRYMEVETSWRQWGFGGPMWDKYRKDYGCIYHSLNTATHTRIYNCSNVLVDCSFVTSCPSYPNQRACDYDPCNLGCDKNCDVVTTTFDREESASLIERLFRWAGNVIKKLV